LLVVVATAVSSGFEVTCLWWRIVAIVIVIVIAIAIAIVIVIAAMHLLLLLLFRHRTAGNRGGGRIHLANNIDGVGMVGCHHDDGWIAMQFDSIRLDSNRFQSSSIQFGGMKKLCVCVNWTRASAKQKKVWGQSSHERLFSLSTHSTLVFFWEDSFSWQSCSIVPPFGFSSCNSSGKAGGRGVTIPIPRRVGAAKRDTTRAILP
jgi:hypothetical protein